MSEAVEKNPIEDLIQHSLDQDYNKANEIFGSIIGTKLDDALEQEKIKMANSVYNGVEDDEEQLDFDLEPDDDTDAEESTTDQDTEEIGSEVDDETESSDEEEEEVDSEDIDGHPV